MRIESAVTDAQVVYCLSTDPEFRRMYAADPKVALVSRGFEGCSFSAVEALIEVLTRQDQTLDFAGTRVGRRWFTYEDLTPSAMGVR